MSKKRVVLIAAMVLLCVPSAALADGVDFGFSGGVADVTGIVITNASGLGVLSNFDFIRRTPAPPGVNLNSNPGQPWGTVAVTSGVFCALCPNTLTTLFFSPGGSIVITANATFQTFTGGAVTAGTIVFSGVFSAIQTFTQSPTIACPQPLITSLSLPAGTLCDPFRMTGLVSGTIDASLLGFLGLNGSANSSGTGFLSTLDFLVPSLTFNTMQIAQGDANLQVPEPGTLALFGSGLIGIAGLLRRKKAA